MKEFNESLGCAGGVKFLKQSFIYSSALILVITALAKLVSAKTDAKILHAPDPLLGIEYQWLLPSVAAFELIVAAILVMSRTDRLRFFSLFWLSLNFVLYRLGFWITGTPTTHCKCLGHLTDALNLEPESVENMMRGAVVYLLVGSAVGLAGGLWKDRSRARYSRLSAAIEN